MTETWADEGGSLWRRCSICGRLFLEEQDRICPECTMIRSEENTRILLDEIVEERQRIAALPILEERWYVIETVEAHIDEKGELVPLDVRRISPYFDSRDKAEQWMIKHHKQYGYSIRKQYLREFTEKRWSSF